MALSLPGERSAAVAARLNPFVAFVCWIAKAQAARTRRVALKALLELDHVQLNDLGISRSDISEALVRGNKCPELVLNAARARNAHL